jgi:hypothetical protein
MSVVQENLQPLKGAVVSESGLQVTQTDIESLHDEIDALRRANTRLQTFYQMKFQSMRQNFEQTIQAFTTTLSSNSDLWERASEIKEREIIAEQELAGSHRRIAAASDTVDRIATDSAREAETAARLQSWKAHAFEWLDTLQNEERKYQLEDHIDLKRLGHQITKLDAEIKHLNQGDLTEVRIDVEKHNGQIKTKHLKHQIQIEDKLTQKIQRKAELVQREMEFGNLVDDESLVALLSEEHRALAQQLAEVDARNAALKSKLQCRSQGKSSADIEADPNSTEFEQNMCYSVGFMKCPQAPWYRSPIDSSLEQKTPRAVSKTPSSPRTPRQHHWANQTNSQRKDVLASLRNDIQNMEPTKGLSASVFGAKRAGPFSIERRRDIPFDLLDKKGSQSVSHTPKEKVQKRATLQTLPDSVASGSGSPRKSAIPRTMAPMRRSVM